MTLELRLLLCLLWYRVMAARSGRLLQACLFASACIACHARCFVSAVTMAAEEAGSCIPQCVETAVSPSCLTDSAESKAGVLAGCTGRPIMVALLGVKEVTGLIQQRNQFSTALLGAMRFIRFHPILTRHEFLSRNSAHHGSHP